MFLDERKQKILGAVVRAYVESVRPVGSEELVQRHALGVKSATIRNELAELAELGYLKQPHTSAGRIPSDRGYRFYVDHLMVAQRITVKRSNTSSLGGTSLELERILRLTCSMLTRHTSYTSVATPPRPADTTVNHIFITSAGDGRTLIVVLFSSGHVENRLQSDSYALSATDLIVINNALNATFSEKTLHNVQALGEQQSISAPADLPAPLRPIFDTLSTQIRQMTQSIMSDDRVVMEGTREMLKQPEFRDVDRFETMLDSFHGGVALFEMLSRSGNANATVVIGEENDITAMQECSIITAPYYAGASERGTIGVVGPTRMDYDHAVPAVNYFARALSQTLARLGRA